MRLSWTALSLCLAAAPARAVEVSPIYGLQVMGGQYFFAGERGSLTGNASAVVAPALKFNDRWSLLPALNSSYQGTKQVVDLVGAGTLFQEQMDHRLSARGVYHPEGSLWKLKPSASFKYELLKETRNEDWGRGLFDYRKWGLGFEAEYVYRDPFSVRFSLDYFDVSFPNYVSLESQAAGIAGLSRELIGDYVLNNNNAAFGASIEGPLSEGVIGEASVYSAYSRFSRQHLVDSSGALMGRLRQDLTTSLSGGLKMPAEINSGLRLLSALQVSGIFSGSDQNYFDAQRTQFIPLYYNYQEVKVSPSFKALIGPAKQPIIAGLAGSYAYRSYPHRLAQDATGVYQSATIDSSSWMVSSSLTYPMAPHFSLLFNLQYGRTVSNQRFEQFYKYNYTATNYLFGFSYDF